MQSLPILVWTKKILPLLKNNLGNDDYKKIRNEIFDYSVFSSDGHATERQAKRIMDVYNKSLSMPFWLFSLMMKLRHSFRRFKLKQLEKEFPLTPE